MKRMLRILFVLTVLLLLPIRANAEEVTGFNLVTGNAGFSDAPRLFDSDTIKRVLFSDHAQLTLSCPEGFSSLYLIFDVEYGPYTITDLESGEVRTFGEKDFLHEFVDLQEAFGCTPTKIMLSFDNGEGRLNELRAFTSGALPEDVQIWETPKDGETDLILFSTHGDDDQLFFAGLLPDYAGQRGYQVQVVYQTNHRNLTKQRCHEMLDGLWAVGVRAYPVFGTCPDLLTDSVGQLKYQLNAMGITDEDMLGFVVEQLRRFKPLAVVGHDLKGEYGHSQHIYYADLLTRAVEISADPEQFPESAQTYGTWDVPKTYLHLYPENSIVMDWDQPLEAFDGMTAFEVTRDLGFPCHKSQFWMMNWYLSYKKSAATVYKYSPCKYGLYRSTVGEDVQKNDFMENLTSYAQKKAEEEAARLAAEEEARKAAEEAARLEEERLEAERKEREEQQRLEQLRQEELRQLQLQQEAAREELQRRKQFMIWCCAGALAVLVLLGAVIVRLNRHK